MNRWSAMLVLLPALAYYSAAHTQAIDNPHFYRATNFYGEPRLEKAGLQSIDISVGFGATHQSRNELQEKTCLLNIYGNFNMLALGQGVPNKNPANAADLALINLSRLPAGNNFAQLIYQGRFSIVEANISFTQNLKHGFFLQATVPVRSLTINNVESRDLSPTGPTAPNINTVQWQTFLNQFSAILQRYDLCLGATHNKGVGDTSTMLGWTYNYQETEILDYIDMTVKGGVLVATGKRKDEDKVFDLPLGYNGFNGIPLMGDLSIGAYDWLTVGTHMGVIVFKGDTRCIRMKTDINQSGFIKLAKGTACISPGLIWEASVYAKADHICRGFSALAGYSFARKNADKVSPRAGQIFNYATVNSDQMFKEWQMHTLNFMAEYDFTKENAKFGPRVGVFYNLEVGGKRVFNTSVGGLSCGLDIALAF